MKLKISPSTMSTGFMFAVVRLTAIAPDGDESIGTGFFFQIYGKPSSDVLVTNKHVIEGAEEIHFPLHVTSIDHEGRIELGSYEIYSTKNNEWIPHPDPNVDLCCWPVKQHVQEFHSKGYFYQPISSACILEKEELERLPTSIGIAMVGFPSGLWDKEHGLPIFRRGTTASHAAIPFDGNTDVMVDIACFPGSSGSPILFDERSHFGSVVKFLGVLHSGPTISNEGEVIVTSIPTRKRVAVVDTMMHLGYAASADRVLELAELVSNEG